MDGVISDLKSLGELLKSLPNLAVWIAVGFYVYKLAILGSIYGAIRYIAKLCFDAYALRVSEKKYAPIEVREWKGVGVISQYEEDLIKQLKRLRCRIGDETSKYIHGGGVEVLEKALDAYLGNEKNLELTKKVVDHDH